MSTGHCQPKEISTYLKIVSVKQCTKYQMNIKIYNHVQKKYGNLSSGSADDDS